MYCKDCLYFKELKSAGKALCRKTGKLVENDDRPCDDFILRGHMMDEWGQSPCGGGTCR